MKTNRSAAAHQDSKPSSGAKADSGGQNKPTEASRTRWKLLLLLPFAGLCFPVVYARNTPVLFGFPFFYWYQLVWVVLASAIMGLVYRKLRY